MTFHYWCLFVSDVCSSHKTIISNDMHQPCIGICMYIYTLLGTRVHLLIYWLTEMNPDVLFCCCSPSTSRFNVLSMQRSFSAFSGSLNQSACFTSDLLYPHSVSSYRTVTHSVYIFCVFGVVCTILCNSRDYRDCCVWNSQLLKSDQPIWHQQPCHVQSHEDHMFSTFWCLKLALTEKFWPVCMIICIMLLQKKRLSG